MATRTVHCASGGVRSGHQSLKPHPRTSGRSRKSSSGHAMSQTEVLSCASTASMASGNPSGRATMVATVRTTSSVVAMLTSALASRARIGCEGHACAQGRDAEPDLDLVREWTRRSSAGSR